MKPLKQIIINFIKSPYLALILRFYIGFIFMYAAMSKIPYPGEFAEALAAYRIVPYWAINFISVVLPWLEMLCGLFLIIGLLPRATSGILGILLLGFTFSIMVNLIRGAKISCGCFDTTGDQISWWAIARDLSWFLLTVQVFFFDKFDLFQRLRVVHKRKSV